jgi:TPR repeat protein
VVACKGSSSSKVIEDAATGDDPAELAARFDKKCVAGDLEACRQLGVMYQEGTGVSPDLRRATALFGQACNGGNLSACNNLGLDLAEGIGVDKNPTRALEVYQKACDGGFKLACRNAGLMYRDGRGVAADIAKAEVLLDKACKGAVPFACKNAGDLDATIAAGGNVARWKDAITHYKQGCDTGDPSACRQIGILYLEGNKGLPKSTAAAAVWLERACLPDDPVACRLLGEMVIQGVGVARDIERGKQLLARACDAKDDEACRVLKLASESANDAGVSAGDAGSAADNLPAGSASDAAVTGTR